MSNPNQGFRYAQKFQLPAFIADEQGQAFEESFGGTKDDALDLYREATKARYPSADRPDALPYQAHDRLILRAPPETDAEHADRLTRAPDLWTWGGTPTAMVQIFEPYGYDSSTCLVVPNYAVILEGNLEWFSRFIILLGPVYWNSDGVWGGLGSLIGATGHAFTMPNVGLSVDIDITSPTTWTPTAGSTVYIDTAGDFYVSSVGSGIATCVNLGTPGSASPGASITAPQNVYLDTDLYDDAGTWDTTASIADLDYIRASVRVGKSDESYPILVGVQLADIFGDGFWDVGTDVYDAQGTFWSDDTDDVAYWLLGEFWGQEDYFGGGPGVWPATASPGDVWGDFVPPTYGWGFLT